MSDFQIPTTLKTVEKIKFSTGDAVSPIKAFKPAPALRVGSGTPSKAQEKTTTPACDMALTMHPAEKAPAVTLDFKGPDFGASQNPSDVPSVKAAAKELQASKETATPRLRAGTGSQKKDVKLPVVAKPDPELESMKTYWPFPETQKKIFRLGTIIKLDPTKTDMTFREGETMYPYAVIVCLEPLVVASKDGNGRWVAGKDFFPDHVLHCGEAHTKIYAAARARFEK